mmetsp:Transcript_45021/g.82279  ORF Transcript_45021/g.82279 Transcript_45021/m.82279 type:complete len:284 (+) Transcript_45021:90-941(+)
MAPAAVLSDFGACTMELQSADDRNTVYPWLVVTTRAQPHTASDLDDAFAALDDILSQPGVIVGLYDLRQHRVPSLRQVRDVAQRAMVHKSSWQTQFAAAAVVLEPNAWAAVLKGFVSAFVSISQPSCPIRVCFDMAEAEEFLFKHMEDLPTSEVCLPREASADSMQSFHSFHSIASLQLSEELAVTAAKQEYAMLPTAAAFHFSFSPAGDKACEGSMSRAESFASMASWHSSCTKKDVVAIYDRPGMTQLIILYDLMQKNGTVFLKALADVLWPTTKFCSVCG